ncbi:hypothetical protein Tco_1174414 [Tanacetum coccineum]
MSPLLLLASIECDIVNSTQHHVDSSISREITSTTFAQPTLLKTFRENNLHDSASGSGLNSRPVWCHIESSTRGTYYTLTVEIVTTSRYVVPTGRVKVPAGRYVVPTGKDNVIVSAGRSKVIPAGRTILVLVVLCLLRVDSIVS